MASSRIASVYSIVSEASAGIDPTADFTPASIRTVTEASALSVITVP